MSFEGIIHAQRMHTGDFFGGSDSDHDAFDARVAAEVEETLERMDTSLAGRNELQEAVERSDAADVQALAQDQEMEATEALQPSKNEGPRKVLQRVDLLLTATFMSGKRSLTTC